MLELKDGSFRYPGCEALFEGVDLAIEPGERVAVLGLNGSGKSTFLRCLAGLTPLTGGRLLIDGLDPSAPADRSAALALIGFLFESPEEQALAPTVEREIAFGLENRGVEPSRIRILVDEMMRSFGLSALASRHPSALSGGERQRLALASVFVEAPRYLFLDEPTSRLDAAGRENLKTMIDTFRPRPAMIEVTLRRENAGRAGRVLLIAGGRVRSFSPDSSWGETASALHPELPRREAATPAVRARATAASGAPGGLLRAEQLAFTPPGAAEPLFEGLSLVVVGGKALVVTGPTASGKTTLLRMLAGFEKVRTGSVSACRRPDPRVGFMPQFPERLLFAPTVLEDVAFGAERFGASKDGSRKTARACLQVVQLDPERFGSAFPGDLSYGERRRVALAGLLSADPAVLLLDEPEVGLDPPGRRILGEIIAGLLNRGTGVVVATHEPDWLSVLPGVTLVLEKASGSRTVVAA